MRFEAGMQRDIPSDSLKEKEIPSQEDKLKMFAADRAQAWSGQEQPVDMGAEAERAKETAILEQESSAERLADYQKRIETLRIEISEKKHSVINRLLEFRRINDLEKNLGVLGKMQGSAEEDKRRSDELIAGYDFIISQDTELTSIKAQARDEMQQRDQERFAALEKEEKARGVSDIAARHQCFVVHDIVDAEWKPSANNQAVDTKQLSFDDQLDIVLGFEPTIAASSLREGNPQDDTFSEKGGWGVFLRGGRTLGGYRSDLGTRATGLRERYVPEQFRGIEAIDEAITSPEKTRYNELVIEKPEVAGVYIKWTDVMPKLSETMSIQNGDRVGYDLFWEKLKATAEKNIPIFVLTPENRAYMISGIDVERRTFRVAKAEMQPEDMTNLPGIYQQHLGETEKRTVAMRQIDKVQHLLSSEEVSGVKTGSVLTDADMKNDPYRLH